MSALNKIINKFFEKDKPVFYRKFQEEDLIQLPSIYPYKSGKSSVRYRSRLTIGQERETGRKITKNFYGPDYESVEQQVRDYIRNEIDGRTLRDAEKRMVNYKIEQWLRTEKLGRVRPRTYDRLDCTYRNQIKPYLEGIELQDLTKDDCQRVLRCLVEKGYAASTVRQTGIMLREFLNLQAAEDPGFRNPMATLKNYSDEYIEEWQATLRQVREEVRKKAAAGKRLTVAEQALLDSPLRMRSSPVKNFTQEEIDRIKDVVRNGYVRTWTTVDGRPVEAEPRPLKQAAVFLFLMNTGLRDGEARALRYTDVDFEAGKLTVSRNRTYMMVRDTDGNAIGGGRYVEGRPKTKASRRVLFLSKAAMGYLEELRAQEKPGYDGYIINSEGKPMGEGAFRNRFQRLLKSAGVEPRGLHALRHTFASRYYEYCGGNRKLVGDYLGHSSRNVTEAIYVSLSDEFQRRAIEDFEI